MLTFGPPWATIENKQAKSVANQGKLALDNIDLEMQMERKDLIGNPKSDLF